MTRQPFTATSLRLTLSISMMLIVAIAWISIHFLNENLKSFATTVSHVSADSKASQDNLATLQKIEKELNANAEVIGRARSIVADSQSYQYQDQIITDLTDYANKAGLTITNIDFSANKSSTPVATPGTATPAPTGVKTTSVSVTVNNPVDYEKLLRFIKSIEQNLTKMQISRVGLAKGEEGGISSEVFVIEVYIR